MEALLPVEATLADRFPGLRAYTYLVSGVRVQGESAELEAYKGRVVELVRERYSLETLKDVKVFRSYRDFFWRVGIDPTKNRPASEALVRRILGGKSLPKINTLVDAYNMASVVTEMALAAFDAEKLRGSLVLREARGGERFLGIGMASPMELKGGEVAISDGGGIIALYPHRDGEYSKIGGETRRTLMVVCGVPGIGEEALERAGRVTLGLITRFCGGAAETGPPDVPGSLF